MINTDMENQSVRMVYDDYRGDMVDAKHVKGAK